MGEIAISVLFLLIKFSTFASVAISFVVLFGFITSAIVVGFNNSVLADLMAIVQLWLPFDLNVMIVWLLTVAGLYIAYRLFNFTSMLLTRFLTR